MKYMYTVMVLFCMSTMVLGGKIPQTTELILKDTDGNLYNIDKLLDEGNHIGVVSTGSD